MSDGTDDVLSSKRVVEHKEKTSLQLYCYSTAFLSLGICCWALALSFLHCPSEVRIVLDDAPD